MAHRRSDLPAAALVLLALLGCGAGDHRPEPPRRVFLITVDTLRADHLGAYGYPRDTSPNLDALAAEGVLFERAFAQWPKTGASLASLFLGRYPQTTGLTHRATIEIPPAELTLPELFQAAGYTTLAVVGNAVLSAKLGWDHGFDEYVEPWELADERPETRIGWKELLSARSLNRLALPLLERHRDAERLFVWLHYMDPHGPYYLLEGENPFLGDAYYTGDAKVDESWFPRRSWLGDEDELRYYVAQYDANVRLADRYIAAALAHAEDLGLLEDALLVFTSDHGEALGQDDYMGHGMLPHNPGIHVPLFFRYPGVIPEGRRIERPVELIDVWPTLLDFVAPELAVDGLEGRSLLGLLTGDEPDVAGGEPIYAFSEAGIGKGKTHHFRMVQDGRWKLVHHPPVGKRRLPERWWLYDLEDDPRESRDLVDEAPPELRRLHAELTGWMDTRERPLPPEEGESRSRELVDALRALGYVD